MVQEINRVELWKHVGVANFRVRGGSLKRRKVCEHLSVRGYSGAIK